MHLPIILFLSVGRLQLQYSSLYNIVHASDVFIYHSLTLLTLKTVDVMYSYEQEMTRIESVYFLFITFYWIVSICYDFFPC